MSVCHLKQGLKYVESLKPTKVLTCDIGSGVELRINYAN